MSDLTEQWAREQRHDGAPSKRTRCRCGRFLSQTPENDIYRCQYCGESYSEAEMWD